MVRESTARKVSRNITAQTEAKRVSGVKKAVRKTVEPVTPIEIAGYPEVETPENETPIDFITTPGGTRKRREVTPDTVDEAFNELCLFIKEEIERQRDLKEKNGGKTANILRFKII